MKKFLFSTFVLLAVLCFGQMPKPVWELNLTEGDFDSIVSTGSRQFKARVVAKEKLEWGPGRLGGQALYIKNDLKCKERPFASIEIPATEHFDFSKPFTAMCWFKPDVGLSGSLQYTVFGNTPSDYGPGFRMIYGWGSLRASMGQGTSKTGGGFSVPASKVKVAKGTWNHIAISNDGNMLRIFYNGIEAASTDKKIYPVKPRPFTIGSYNCSAYGFNGGICEFKMFDVALTPEQILTIAKEL